MSRPPSIAIFRSIVICRGDPWVAQISRTNDNMRNAKDPFSYRRSMRLRGFDYRKSGVYFVTICTYQKMKLFGRVDDGEMSLSMVGELACEEWQQIAQSRSSVHLDYYVVMPNHLHGLVIIEETHDRGIQSSDSATLLKRINTLQAGSLGAIIGQFKAAVSRRVRSEPMDHEQPIWQRNYHEHIVRDETSLNEIRRYIMENPARWREDSMYVD